MVRPRCALRRAAPPASLRAVNNAGVFRKGTISGTTVTDWDFVMNINVTGTFLGMKAAGALMQRAGSGSIINISSIAGLGGTGNSAAYSTSKWAVRGLTKAGAKEMGPAGVRCNSVHPGLISTRMLHADDATGVGIPPGASPESVPLGRLAEASEVATVVLFLASDDAGYVNGAEFTVDGGMSSSL